MIVYSHFENPDGGDLGPVKSAVGLSRRRLVGYLEDQPIRMVQVHRKLSLSVPLQFVASSLRQGLHNIKRVCCVELVQPPPDPLGPPSPQCLSGLLVAIADPFNPPITKDYIHVAAVVKFN